MSNYLAVATVTGTLQHVLSAAAAVVPGAKVSTTRPDGAAPAAKEPAINVFLYQVTPNAAYRNCDLPTRRANGTLVQRPQAAMTLHYLLSFYGDENNLEPQRLFGAAARQLHARPLLTQQDVVQTLANPPYDTLLASSNLADQLDLVRFTPLDLSLEELSKLWSIFFQSPYMLSVAYQASAVLIETEDAPQPALPVQTRNLYVMPFQQPVIDKVSSTAGDFAPVFATSTLQIDGKQLQGDVTLVLLGGIERPPLTISDKQITLAVPTDLQAGARGLQVIQKLLLGSPAPGTPHRGFESNVATFVLRPRITLPVVKTTLPDPQGGAPLPALQVTVDLTVGKNQRAVLLLNSTTTSASGNFLTPPRAADGTSLTIAIPGVPAGQYFLRLQIDGAESPVVLDPASVDFGPTVTLP
jgi:Pvc16 N-terminal domain